MPIAEWGPGTRDRGRGLRERIWSSFARLAALRENGPYFCEGSVRIDLHVHTTASDGLLDPPALVRAVKEAGIGVFGLADHDTVDGIPELNVIDFGDSCAPACTRPATS